MFKVVGVKLTAKNGKMTAVITLSGSGYDYLYMGTGKMRQQRAAHGSLPPEKWTTP